MAYVIAEPCIGTKDTACVDACPVDCIHPKKDEAQFGEAKMLYIDPVECIDCGACVPVCPVSAIFALDDLPEKWSEFAQENAAYFGGKLFAPWRGRLQAPRFAGRRAANTHARCGPVRAIAASGPTLPFPGTSVRNRFAERATRAQSKWNRRVRRPGGKPRTPLSKCSKSAPRRGARAHLHPQYPPASIRDCRSARAGSAPAQGRDG